MRTMTALVMGAVIGIVLTFIPKLGHAIIFSQKDNPTTHFQQVDPGQDYVWTDKNGIVHSKPCPGGCVIRIDDVENKGVTVDVPVGGLMKLVNPDYGLNGEQAVAINGQITSGTGAFHLSISGLQNIADVSTTFTATLLSNGTDNPVQANLFGQGDQLQPPKNGTLSFISKWESLDTIPLSDGDSLQIGAFFLNSVGDPSAFTYSLSLSPEISATADLIIGQDMLFVKDLSQPPIGSNLRQTYSGSLTAHLETVPEPSTWLLLGSGLAGIAVFGRKRLTKKA